VNARLGAGRRAARVLVERLTLHRRQGRADTLPRGASPAPRGRSSSS
jgi:hypothetical protein